MKYLFPLLYFIFLASVDANAQNKQGYTTLSVANINYNSRSDSADIIHTFIELDLSKLQTKQLKGRCTITWTPKINNLNNVRFDLLKLTTDSVYTNNVNSAFYKTDSSVTIPFSSAFNIGDTIVTTFFYHGQPALDATGWGGFYFTGVYAYNLGVGFGANPHVYGRVWFPCFDNFIERSAFTFNVKTKAGNKAACNGMLINTINNPDTTTNWIWQLNEPVPSYLVCVAVAPYQTVRSQYVSITTDTIPVELYALAADTTKVKNSFLHLPDALRCFETHFGPYRWPKVGYSMVPFNSGAMEHATNIAYPLSSANGTLTDETLFAHELSHHWWGDLATCETAEDMWLNEGWASYSENLFTEWVYGRNAYVKNVELNHTSMIRFAHVAEGNYWPVSGVPFDYTYGDHVYKKGADMVHTLRGYLGDSLFFAGITAYLNSKNYASSNSAGFRDFLTTYTGVDLNDYFKDWVFNGGWPHVGVTELTELQPVQGNYPCKIKFSLKSIGRSLPYTNIPYTITFYDSSLTLKQTYPVTITGNGDSILCDVPFKPYCWIPDDGHFISEGISPEERWIKQTGTYTFTNIPQASITTRSFKDSAWVHTDHHWANQDTLNAVQGIYVSRDRYLHIKGFDKNRLNASFKFFYDGRVAAGSGNLDVDLFNFQLNEDSMVVLYKSGVNDPWGIYPYYTKNVLTNKLNKQGYVVIDSLRAGFYTLGMKDGYLPTALTTFPLTNNMIKLNKLNNKYLLAAPKNYFLKWKVLSINGTMVKEDLTNNRTVDITGLSAGIYLLQVSDEENNAVKTFKIVK